VKALHILCSGQNGDQLYHLVHLLMQNAMDLLNPYLHLLMLNLMKQP
jgi:hypothetical protein